MGVGHSKEPTVSSAKYEDAAKIVLIIAEIRRRKMKFNKGFYIVSRTDDLGFGKIHVAVVTPDQCTAARQFNTLRDHQRVGDVVAYYQVVSGGWEIIHKVT